MNVAFLQMSTYIEVMKGKETGRHKEREREKDRKTERQKNRKTEKQK